MSTDPFDAIAFQQEIGQPTYAELIYTEVREGKAFPPSTATVENSLNRLAFGKPGPYKDIPIQTPPKLTPSSPTRRPYNVSGTNEAATQQALRQQRVTSEFRSLLSNSIGPKNLNDFINQLVTPSISTTFNELYHINSLGTLNIPAPGGGLVFKAEDPNKIIVGGAANSLSGALYEFTVIRDSGGHITGVGPASYLGSASYVDSGITYEPTTGVLFVCGWPDNLLHQYKPGNYTTPSKTINLGVNNPASSIGFVPASYPGSGRAKLVIRSAGIGYDITLIPDGTGTFNIGPVAPQEGALLGNPAGFTYVPLGSALFAKPSMMVTEYSSGAVGAYELDEDTGWAIVSSRRAVAAGLTGARGAAVDPVTGDYILSTFDGTVRLWNITGGFVPYGFSPPAADCIVSYPLDHGDVSSNANPPWSWNWTDGKSFSANGPAWDVGNLVIKMPAGTKVMYGYNNALRLSSIPGFNSLPAGNWVRFSFKAVALRAGAPAGSKTSVRFGVYARSGDTTSATYVANNVTPFVGWDGCSHVGEVDVLNVADPDNITLVERDQFTTITGVFQLSSHLDSVDHRCLCVGLPGSSPGVPLYNGEMSSIFVTDFQVCKIEGEPEKSNRIKNSRFDIISQEIAPVQPPAGYKTEVYGWNWDQSAYGIWEPVGRVLLKNGLFYQAVSGLIPLQSLSVTFTAHWKNIRLTNPSPVGVLRAIVRTGSVNGTIIFQQDYTGQTGDVRTISFATSNIDSSGVAYVFFQVFGNSNVFTDPEIELNSVYARQTGVGSDECTLPITNVRALVQWNGVPRQPVNLFSLFLRLVYRHLTNPFDKTVRNVLATTDGRLGTVTPVSCSNANTCDFWKQIGSGGQAVPLVTTTGLNQGNIVTIENNQLTSVASRTNWLWAIPGSTTANNKDALVSVFDDNFGEDGYILESVEILGLIQVLNPTTPTVPVCDGPFNCGLDPAVSIDFVIRYQNIHNQAREFRKTFPLSSIYPMSTNTTNWDTLTALGYGALGHTARWESAKFILDAPDGSGLDQCTSPFQFAATGHGEFKLKKLTMKGRGIAAEACDARIEITETQKGNALNEIQSIVLPSPTGGVWTLRFEYSGLTGTTANIPANAPASTVQSRLEEVPIIGVGNVLVSGNGTSSKPYVVEFINLLGGRDFPLLKANGSNLTGSATAFAVKLVTGTMNERQTITKDTGNNTSLTVTFIGVPSAPIASDASLNAFQLALEGIGTIGAGNVLVSGTIADRNASYQGPWNIDFIGGFAGHNVAPLVVQTGGYTATTDWQGGVGTGDVQKVMVTASNGSFKLQTAYPPSGTQVPPPVPVTTVDININAGASQVKQRLVEAASWLTNADLSVTRLDSGAPDLNQWRIKFVGQWLGKEVPLLTVINSNLEGGKIVVEEVVKGFGLSDKQKINILKAGGGTYRLVATAAGTTATTVSIPWNASAEGVELALQALPIFPLAEDVAVIDAPINQPDVVISFTVSFGRRFGDLQLLDSVNNLQCHLPALSAIGPPPYDYNLMECEEDDSIFCSPGPLLCRPGEGDDEVPEEICCDQLTIRESANVYREVMLQRDLFDPNTSIASGKSFTIKDMAVLKGLRPSQYNAYLRDFYTGALKPVDMSTLVYTKMSVLLIGTSIDTKTTRERLSKELKRRPEILPSRMSWSNPILQGSS